MNGVFYVTLRSGSISGAILGTSSLLTISPSASAPSNFIFSDAIHVNPGTMYYFNLVIQGGNRWATPWDRYNYASGVGYGNGVANANFDMWFREGIIVPEPGVMVLLGLGLLGYVVRRTKR